MSEVAADRQRWAATKRAKYFAELEVSRAKGRAEMARYRQARRDERDEDKQRHREVSLLLLRWPRVNVPCETTGAAA